MTGFIRSRIGRGGATLLLVAAGGLAWRFFLPTGPERQFVPGAIGGERGFHAAAGDGVATAFRTRAMTGLSGPDAEEWARANALTAPLAFSHNLGRVFPPELFARHPESFPLIAGRRLKPAPGSNNWNPDLARPEVAAQAAAAARAHFTGHPESGSFALGINDGLLFGESPETLALTTPVRWFRERPDYAPLVFTFMNRAAGELARTHPGKYLGCLAYYWAENAPGFPLHPQVVPFLTADRAQGYDADFRRQEFDLQKRWAAAGPKRLGLYDYLYGGGFLIPRIHTRLLAENLRQARRAGFTDYFAEANPNWGLDGPMPWLTAQLLLDPEQSESRLLDEYYGRYFREAAEPMRRFFGRCEAQWMTQKGPPYWLKYYRDEAQAGLFPSPVCRELRVLLADAARQARSWRVRERVRLVSSAFGVTERFVHLQESRDALNRLVLARTAGWKTMAVALEEFRSARAEFAAYTRQVQTRQPLALAPFQWDDYLRHDPVPAAILAIEAGAAAAGETGRAEDCLRSWRDDGLMASWRLARVAREGRGMEVLRNAGMAGRVLPARTIAELPYGVALPAEWQSKVEPAQHHRAGLSETEPRVLRISGSADTQVFQWNRVPRGAAAVLGRVMVRGHVTSGTVVMLTLGWLDRAEEHLPTKVIRLPAGDWGEWVTLELMLEPPAGAAWVGLGLRVQYQVAGDWAEAKGFALQSVP
jgi:hypothetical protein